MKNKTTVAMLLLVIFALSSIAIIQIKPVKASGTLTLSDTELYSEFGWKFDPGSSLTGKTDVAGPGVRFDVAGLGKAGICDDHPISSSAGGSLYPGTTDYCDFTAYDKYSMLIINVGTSTIEVDLFMNTGFTNDGPWGTGRNWHYDTFWKGTPVTLDPGESAVLTLDFSSTYQAWNIADDPVYTGHTDGETGTAIFRLDEVSCIGFEVLGSGSASVIASGTLTHLYIDPPETSTPDSFFDVYVTLSDFTNLAGFDIQLTWDSTHISMAAVDYATYCTALWGAEGTKWNKVFESSPAGSYELAVTALAASASNAGASYLFKVSFNVEKTCNFPLSTAISFTVTKLSDNATPVPNPIPATITDGLFTTTFTTRPDITFSVLKKIPKSTGTYQPISPPYDVEYCDYIEVEVYVSHIHDCSPLKDYDVTIYFDPGLAAFVDVDVWGIFGTGTVVYTPGTPNVVHVSDSDLTGWSGELGLLFTLTFHIEFGADAAHIWKYGSVNHMTFNVWLYDVTLSFGTLGTIPMSGIDTPSPLTFDVYFIRGDVTCDGVVNLDDISSVAYYYGKPVSDKPEYDLTNSGTIIDIYDIVTIATNFGYGM